MTDQTAPSYCVIGAGAAGLAAVDALARAGHRVVCYEQRQSIGGHWNHDYESLHLITPREISGYVGVPMPDDYPTFPSRDQMRDYIRGFARARDLNGFVELATTVVRLEPVGGDPVNGWLVSLEDGRSHRFDGVVVASGHLWDPNIPGMAARFDGVSLHSSTYQNSKDLRGPRVLVIGAGNSGCDIAVDAVNARCDVSISMRSGRLFQPKTLYGKPRNELRLLARLPARLQERILRHLVRVAVGRPEDHRDLLAPSSRSLFRNLPVVNELLLHFIDHGRIRVVGEVFEISTRRVTFADGGSEEFDSIIWATGFRVTLPFLQDGFLKKRNDVPLRSAGGVLPVGIPRLFFIGLIAPRGPQLPVYSAQSELLLLLLRLQEQMPGPLSDVTGPQPKYLDAIDCLRHLWERDMSRSRRIIRRHLKREPARFSRSSQRPLGEADLRP